MPTNRMVRRIALTACAVLYLVGNNNSGAETSSGKERAFLDRGQSLEAAGQLTDALAHYKRALEENPSNHLTQFRCGMVCIELEKSKCALKFLSKAFEIRPDFTEALLERGRVSLKVGDLNSAKNDYLSVLHREPANREASLLVKQIDDLRPDIPFAKLLFKQKDYEGSIEILDKALELCPWHVALREIRAEGYLLQAKFVKAIKDVRSTLNHRGLKTPAYLKLSLIYYDMGDTENSLVNIRECLMLDPDHVDCDHHYKKVKTLVKQIQLAEEYKVDMQHARCVRKANKILQVESTVPYYVLKAKGFLCHCHLRTSLVSALAACDEVLEANPDVIEHRMARAEICMELINENLHQAEEDYQYIKRRTEENADAADGLKKVKDLLKLSEKKDYYKILALERSASFDDVIKAYKTLAKVWHPDKFKGDDRTKAERMFLDIAKAKEVLTDPMKKAMHDQETYHH